MTLPDATSGLLARVHLDRLRDNAALVCGRIPGHVRAMGVVKCDGYGHGAAAVARVLVENGVSDLVAATVSEGLALRRAGLACPILVLSDPLHPRLQDALDHELTLTVADQAFADRLVNHKVGRGATFQVHVKVDIGLGRFGIPPAQASSVASLLASTGRIRVVGIYSHLSCTFRHDRESDAHTRDQLIVFQRVLDQLEVRGLLPPAVHLGSSTGLLGFADELCSGRLNGLRIGALFYGFMERVNAWPTRPVPIAEVSARILQIRDMKAGDCLGYHRAHRMAQDGRVAVLNAGVCHGLHGDLANGLEPLVHGQPARLIGKPTLSQCMIDISRAPEARVGSEVLLAGSAVNMHALARGIGRGVWELLLPMLANSRKLYVQG